MKFLVDILGWAGAVALLVAYVLVSIKKLEGDSLVYQLVNLAGGGLLIANSFYYGAFPSVLVNVVWVGIAIFALSNKARVTREKGSRSQEI